MSYFGLNKTQQNRELAYAAEHPVGSGILRDADFFDGSATAVFKGLWSGVRQADQLGWAVLDTAITPLAETVSETFGVHDPSADFFRNQRKLAEKSVRELTPDPGTTGTAGQVLFSLGQIGGQAIAGSLMAGTLGAAATVGTLQGFSDYEKSRAAGVDYGTAADKALVTGGTAALGTALPISLGLRAGGAVAEGVSAALSFGRGAPGAFAGAVARAAPDLFYSVGTNVSMGMAERGLSADLLRRRGYEEIARQYDVLDNKALLTEAVLGVAFGGLGRFRQGRFESSLMRQVTTEQVDAALTTASHLDHEVNATPGIPVNALSSNAHYRAMQKAMTDVLTGEPVDVGTLLDGAEFLRKPLPLNLAASSVREALGLTEKGESLRLKEEFEQQQQAQIDDIGMAFFSTPKSRTRDQIQRDMFSDDEYFIRGNDEKNQQEHDIRLAESAIADRPDMNVHIVHPDETVSSVNAAMILDEVSRDVENARHDAKLFEVAVNCFLRNT